MFIILHYDIMNNYKNELEVSKNYMYFHHC